MQNTIKCQNCGKDSCYKATGNPLSDAIALKKQKGWYNKKNWHSKNENDNFIFACSQRCYDFRLDAILTENSLTHEMVAKQIKEKEDNRINEITSAKNLDEFAAVIFKDMSIAGLYSWRYKREDLKEWLQAKKNGDYIESKYENPRQYANDIWVMHLQVVANDPYMNRLVKAFCDWCNEFINNK